MLIHCSICKNSEFVSSEGLRSKATTLPLDILEFFSDNDPLPVSAASGFPYDFDQLAIHLKESLPSWDISVEESEGVRSLRQICPDHFFKIDATNEELKQLEAQIASPVLAKMESLLSKFDTTVSKLDQRLSEMQARIDSLETKRGLNGSDATAQ